MATLFLDFTGGNNSNAGNTFANRFKDVTNGATSARVAAGDVVRIMKSEDPVSLGVTSNWTNKNDSVTLSSATLTLDIDTCEIAWTAVSANVTQSNPTTRKQGSKSLQFNIASAFTTGQIGYYTLPFTLSYASYQKISFWIKPTIAIASGVLKIQLCTDAVGAVPADTFTINEPLTASVWNCITIDKGSAMSAGINSISFDAISDPGTVNIQLDNILACNALTLTSLISPNSGAGQMSLYPIKSIQAATVVLDGGNQDASTTCRGYDGATVTGVTAYKLEPIRYVVPSQTTQRAGTSEAARVTFSGGWDTTAMTSQTGMTFIDFGAGAGFSINKDYNSFENVVVVRGSGVSWSVSGTWDNMNNCGGIGNDNGAIIVGSYDQLTNSQFLCAALTCVQMYSGQGYTSNLVINSCQSSAFYFGGFRSKYYGISVYNNAGSGILAQTGGADMKMYNIVATDNVGGGFNSNSQNSTVSVFGITTSGNTGSGVSVVLGLVKLDDTNCTDTTPFTCGTNGRLQISRLGNDEAVSRIYDNSATICVQVASSPVHGSTSKSWEHSPQSVHTVYFPLIQALQPFAVGSSGTVTFSIWVQRSTTNVLGQIFVKGGQSNGVSGDVTAATSATANTWEQLTITFTPSQNVPIVIELQGWRVSGTGNIFWGDASVSQA